MTERIRWTMRCNGGIGTRRFMSLYGSNWLFVHAVVVSLTDNQGGYYTHRAFLTPFTEVV